VNPLLPWRPAIAFFAALLLWAPSANAFVHGNLDVAPTGVRFLVALTVSWIGVTVLAMIVGGYGNHAAAETSDLVDAEPDTLEG
jgi:hypothetical protein